MNLIHIPSDHKDTIVRLYQGGDKLLEKQKNFDFDVLHAAVGIGTEAGELLRAVLPVHLAQAWSMTHQDLWKGEPGIDIENIKEELGDHLFYEGALRIATNLECLPEECIPPEPETSPDLWPFESGPLSMANEAGIGRKRVLVDLILIHSAIASDILDVAKRIFAYRTEFDKLPEGKTGPTLKERLIQYLVDDCWVVDQIASIIGVSEADLREGNIMKLEKGKKARYKDGFSEQAANDRADKEGEVDDV